MDSISIFSLKFILKYMKTILRFFILLYLLPHISLAQTDTEDPKEAIIKFEYKTLDLGEVLEEKGYIKASFPFKNIGNDTLIIDRVKSGCCPCHWTKKIIAPNDSGIVGMSIDPNSRWDLHKSLTVYSNATEKYTTLFVKGKVVNMPAKLELFHQEGADVEIIKGEMTDTLLWDMGKVNLGEIKYSNIKFKNIGKGYIKFGALYHNEIQVKFFTDTTQSYTNFYNKIEQKQVGNHYHFEYPKLVTSNYKEKKPFVFHKTEFRRKTEGYMKVFVQNLSGKGSFLWEKTITTKSKKSFHIVVKAKFVADNKEKIISFDGNFSKYITRHFKNGRLYKQIIDGNYGKSILEFD